MARFKTMYMGVLNIKIHPHTPDRYVQLMKDAFQLTAIVNIRGSLGGTPGPLWEVSPGDPLSGLKGEFYKFTQIDPRDPWLDILRRSPIRDEEGNPVPQVPEHLKPNFKEVRFIFYPTGHRLFFDASSFSPNYTRILVESLMRSEAIESKYGQVDVIVESSKDAIERILSIQTLTKLEIFITRPNADDVSPGKRQFMARMEKQDARTIREIMTSDRKGGIKPDDETKLLMEIAISNGSVKGTGNDDGVRREESTDPHPLVVREKYDPGKESFWAVFLNISSNLLKRLSQG